MPPDHPDKIAQRCHGMCEGCHQEPAMNLHHRRFLSRGGKHNLANLVALCGSGNHTGCHGDAHGSAPLPGWAISRHYGGSEADAWFQDRVGQWWQFDDEGGKQRRAAPY